MAFNPLTGLSTNKQGFQFPEEDQQALQGSPYPPSNFTGILPTGQTGAQQPQNINIPGYQPNYKDLIANDPVFAQFNQDLSAQGISSAAQRNAAIQQALARYGMVPEGLNLPGDLNLDEARNLGQANTQSGLSVVARQQEQHARNVAMLQDFLAARGGLKSGALGVGLQEAQRDFDRGTYDTQQQLMDYISGVQRAHADFERQQAQARASSMSEAANRQMSLPQNQPTQGSTLAWNPQAGAYGPDGNGKFYDVNGNPVQPPGPAQPFVQPQAPAPPPSIPPALPGGGEGPLFARHL